MEGINYKMAKDKEIVDDLEVILNKFNASFYDENTRDDDKGLLASFYIGQIWGTIMRRETKN